MPLKTRAMVAVALTQAAQGGKHAKARVLSECGSTDILEIRIWDVEGTFRVMYTTRFKEAIYVLHAFKKKSTTGKATPKHEIDLMWSRLKMAEAEHETKYGRIYGKGKDKKRKI